MPNEVMNIAIDDEAVSLALVQLTDMEKRDNQLLDEIDSRIAVQEDIQDTTREAHVAFVHAGMEIRNLKARVAAARERRLARAQLEKALVRVDRLINGPKGRM